MARSMVQDTESRHLDKLVIRLPEGMRDRLKSAAATAKRSMNAEVVARLEASLNQQETQPYSVIATGNASANASALVRLIVDSQTGQVRVEPIGEGSLSGSWTPETQKALNNDNPTDAGSKTPHASAGDEN